MDNCFKFYEISPSKVRKIYQLKWMLRLQRAYSCAESSQARGGAEEAGGLGVQHAGTRLAEVGPWLRREGGTDQQGVIRCLYLSVWLYRTSCGIIGVHVNNAWNLYHA